MSHEKKLIELPEGKMGEIVGLANDSIFDTIGAQVGMSVLVLKHAVQSLIQIGYNQIEVPRDVLDQIIVKEL